MPVTFLVSLHFWQHHRTSWELFTAALLAIIAQYLSPINGALWVQYVDSKFISGGFFSLAGPFSPIVVKLCNYLGFCRPIVMHNGYPTSTSKKNKWRRVILIVCCGTVLFDTDHPSTLYLSWTSLRPYSNQTKERTSKGGRSLRIVASRIVNFLMESLW